MPNLVLFLTEKLGIVGPTDTFPVTLWDDGIVPVQLTLCVQKNLSHTVDSSLRVPVNVKRHHDHSHSYKENI